MSRADYAHWNEDADYMWWHEEGKHVEEPPEPDDYDYDEGPEEEGDICRRCGEEYVFAPDGNAAGDHWPYCDQCYEERQAEDATRTESSS
jgi:hypothetical protein